MEAVKNFDPYRGIRFPSYAVWWVRAYIYRYLINNWRLVKIGTTQAQRKLFFNLRKETERLEARGLCRAAQAARAAHGRQGKRSARDAGADGAERGLARSADLRPATMTRGLSTCCRIARTIPKRPPPKANGAQFAHERVTEFEATLHDKELEIFRARLLTENPDTLQEIGARFGISRERVRQIETRLKQRLKEYIQSREPDTADR